MRLATNTRYNLCTIKSVYVYIMSGMLHVAGILLLVWHYQSLEGLLIANKGLSIVEFVVNAPLFVSTQNLSGYNSHYIQT